MHHCQGVRGPRPGAQQVLEMASPTPAMLLPFHHHRHCSGDWICSKTPKQGLGIQKGETKPNQDLNTKGATPGLGPNPNLVPQPGLSQRNLAQKAALKSRHSEGVVLMGKQDREGEVISLGTHLVTRAWVSGFPSWGLMPTQWATAGVPGTEGEVGVRGSSLQVGKEVTGGLGTTATASSPSGLYWIRDPQTFLQTVPSWLRPREERRPRSLSLPLRIKSKHYHGIPGPCVLEIISYHFSLSQWYSHSGLDRLISASGPLYLLFSLLFSSFSSPHSSSLSFRPLPNVIQRSDCSG